MTVQQAYERIKEALTQKQTALEECGLITKARAFYTDKNLIAKSEFDAKCILVFGNVDIGTSELEEDDWCNFSLCTEIKTATVEDAALESALEEWSAEVDAFAEKVKASDSHSATVAETCRKQEAEAEAAAAEFAQEIKKVRTKMLIGVGIIAVLILAVFFLLPMVI